MILRSPLDITYPCLLLSREVHYVDEYTITYKEVVVPLKDIHKAPIKIPGKLIRNIDDFLVNVTTGSYVVSNNRLFSLEGLIHIKKYCRKIVFVSYNYIKVQGLSFLIRHNEPSIRQKGIGSKHMYAELCEWNNIVAFDSVDFEQRLARHTHV